MDPVYLILGESAEERERAYRLIEEATIPADMRDLCVNTFDGEETTAGEILGALHTAPFLGDRRLVYVRRFDRLAADEQEAIAESCSNPVPGSILVLAADSIDRRRKATQGLLQAAHLVECGQPEGDALLQWVIDQAGERGISLGREAAVVLVEQAGKHLDNLSHELDKVAAYAGEGGTVTADDIAAVVAVTSPEAAQNEIFQLCDAVAEGRVTAVLTSIDRLLGTGANPIYIITMLARHYRRLLAVKSHGGRDPVTLDKELGLRSPRFAVERLQRQAARSTRNVLERCLELLLEADISLKRGGLPRTTLEQTVVSMIRLSSPGQH